MKRQGNLWPTLISEENLMRAITEVNRGHRRTRRHQMNKTVLRVEENKDKAVKALQAVLADGFVPSPTRQRKRWDKSAGKWREISEPKLWPDQYIHHAFIQVLEPVMMRGMDRYCCGSIRGRGIHYGVRAIKRWMSEDQKGTRYCLEMDIHHFYQTLTRETVMNRLRELVKDGKVLTLAEAILSQGVLVGVYSSQWFANTTLQPLDRLIRQLGATHYLRYMDNFTVFAGSKRKLHKVLQETEAWLARQEMKLNGSRQIFPTKARKPNALGYRYGEGYTLLRKRNLLRLKRQAARYYRKTDSGRGVVSPKMAGGLISRLGQLEHCNSKQVRERFYRPKTLKNLKEVIRNESCRRRESGKLSGRGYAEEAGLGANSLV